MNKDCQKAAPCSKETTCKNDSNYLIIIVLYILLVIILGACLTRY